MLNAADAFMKVAYTTSNLMLDDLSASVEVTKRTYAEAITSQNSYQYRTFYHCTNAYHWIRSKLAWNIAKNALSKTMPVPDDHAKPFYEAGTIQNSWNILYNDYCDRVYMHVTREALNKADSRYVPWIKKDTGIETFHPGPTTQPT